MGVSEAGPNGELGAVLELDDEGPESALVLPFASMMVQDQSFSVVKLLDLEQRRRTADFVPRTRLAKHEPFASDGVDAKDLLAEVAQPLAAPVLVSSRIGELSIGEELREVLEPALEVALLRWSIEDEKSNLLPVVALVLTPHDTHRPLELLPVEPQLAVEWSLR